MTDEQFLQKLALLKEQIAAQKIIVTGSTGNKKQQRVTGQNAVKNPFGHGSVIGVLIDFFVLNNMTGRFTKREYAVHCLTKESKLSSHFNNELKKKYGMTYRLTGDSGKVEFSFEPGVSGTIGIGYEIQQRYLQLTSAPRMTADEKQAIIRKTRIR